MAAFVAFLPGMLAGSLCFTIVVHWVTLLFSGWRRNPIDAPLPSTGRVLARVFTVIHPAPWLVLVGIPYAIYRLVSDPPAAGWRWFLAGMAAGLVGMLLLVAFALMRNRRRGAAAPIAPTTGGDNVA